MSDLSLNADKQTVEELVCWVKSHSNGLSLSADRLAFLISLAVMNNDRFEDELTEGELHDAFAIVHRLAKRNAEPSIARANLELNELVSQKLLTRFSAESQLGTSIYRLSPLAVAITDYYLRHKDFSKLKLSIQLTIVIDEMKKAVAAAREDGELIFWQQQVYGTLRYSVSQIFDQIDLNQRSMDEEQLTVKAQISALLSQNWRDAIHNCETLLSETSGHLKELHESLQAVSDELQTQILDIYEQTQGRDELEFVEEMLFRLQTKLDRIINWGQQSIDLWIGYDRHVHKFIRTAIDMDKNRAFSNRLRESIKHYFDEPWSLYVCEGERLDELRNESLVLRDDEVTGTIPADVEFEIYEKVSELMAEKISVMLSVHKQEGTPIDLSQILASHLAEHPKNQHFDLAKIIVEQALKLGYSQADYRAIQPDWQPINDYGAEVQANVIDKY